MVRSGNQRTAFGRAVSFPSCRHGRLGSARVPPDVRCPMFGAMWYQSALAARQTVSAMPRTYTFVFNPEPEGGYTVTCPALPGLVTYGETLEQAREMALDAMEGLIEVMTENGE